MIWYYKRKNCGGVPLEFYKEQNGFQEEKNSETVYHTGNGFYNPYIEPLWKKERSRIRNCGNGIGMAALGYVAISLIAGTLYDIVAQLIFPLVNIRGFLYITETVEWLSSLLIYAVSLLVPFGIFALCVKIPFGVALPFRKAKPDLTFGGLLIGLGASIIASYAAAGLQTVLGSVGIGITMPEYETPVSIPGMILYVIVVAVAPAFIEEIVFRGIVMQSLRRFGDIFALVASSLMFGIFHLNLVQMPYAFIMGLCIGYFVMRSGSLRVGILVHFVNNGVAVAFEFLYPYMTEKAWYLANTVYNLIVVILSVIAIAVLLMKYKDMFRFEQKEEHLTPGQKTFYFATSPVMLAAIAVAVAMTLNYVYLL